MAQCYIPGPPQGKARARTFYNPRLGRVQSITPEKTVLYENLIKTCWIEQTGGTRFPDGAVLAATIVAYFEIPKSAPKKDVPDMRAGRIRPTKKPDMDNIIKTVLDALNGIAYRDDSQITAVVAVKVYTERKDNEPHVTLIIEEST